MRTNRWLFSLACMLSVFVCGNAQKTPSPFKGVTGLFFLGNSITEGRTLSFLYMVVLYHSFPGYADADV